MKMFHLAVALITPFYLYLTVESNNRLVWFCILKYFNTLGFENSPQYTWLSNQKENQNLLAYVFLHLVSATVWLWFYNT